MGPVAPVEPTPDETFNEETRWWRHELLHRRVVRDPELLGLYSDERDQLEATWFNGVAASADTARVAEEQRSRWIERVARHHDAAPIDRRSTFVVDYWRKRDERAHLVLPMAVRLPNVIID
jgi:hypothetical protein